MKSRKLIEKKKKDESVRKRLTLKEKEEILQLHDEKVRECSESLFSSLFIISECCLCCFQVSNVNIANRYGVNKTAVGKIVKKKDQLRSILAGNVDRTAKRFSVPRHPEVDEIMLKWYKMCMGRHLTVSGPMITTRGEKVAKLLGIKGFHANSGWLRNFKRRNGIAKGSLCGETGNVDQDLVKSWKEKDLQEELAGFIPGDIFNMDQTGMFYRQLPDRSLVFIGSDTKGVKLAKDRIT